MVGTMVVGRRCLAFGDWEGGIIIISSSSSSSSSRVQLFLRAAAVQLYC